MLHFSKWDRYNCRWRGQVLSDVWQGRLVRLGARAEGGEVAISRLMKMT